jgi:hypothetical protein
MFDWLAARAVDNLLTVLSLLCALSAAIVGIRVALGSSTEQILASMNARGGMDIFGSDFAALLRSLISDNKWTAWAATLAAASVLFQVVSIFVKWKVQR